MKTIKLEEFSNSFRRMDGQQLLELKTLLLSSHPMMLPLLTSAGITDMSDILRFTAALRNLK